MAVPDSSALQPCRLGFRTLAEATRNSGDDARVHGLTGTTAADIDTARFPILGPVMVYEPAA
jgi:hypothetical protein